MWRRMAEDRQIFRSLRSVYEATAATDSAASALFIHAAQMKCSPFVCSNRGRPTISLCLTHSLLPPPLHDNVNDKSRAARQKSVLKYLSCQFGRRQPEEQFLS